MKKRLFAIALLSSSLALFLPGSRFHPAAQSQEQPYRSNNCVICHAALLEPLAASNRFLEWQMSRHQGRGVSCEKCHGGNPATNDPKLAHKSVLPIAEQTSRLHYRNQPETCGACHQNIVTAFVQSNHYQKLKGIGLGPSCNT